MYHYINSNQWLEIVYNGMDCTLINTLMDHLNYEYHPYIQQFCHSRALQGFFPFLWCSRDIGHILRDLACPNHNNWSKFLVLPELFQRRKFIWDSFLPVPFSFFPFILLPTCSFPFCYLLLCFYPSTTNFSKSLSLPSAFWTFKRCGYTHVEVLQS